MACLPRQPELTDSSDARANFLLSFVHNLFILQDMMSYAAAVAANIPANMGSDPAKKARATRAAKHTEQERIALEEATVISGEQHSF